MRGSPTTSPVHVNHGFDPAFSHQLELDHGIMTVYYELDHDMQLPLVPIVQNCAVPPLVPVRRAYEFGKALGEAIRGYTGLRAGRARRGRRAVALDRQPARRRHRRGIRPLVPAAPGKRRAGTGAGHRDERDRAGRQRQHEMRTWLAVAGAMAPTRATNLAYEPVYHGSPAWASPIGKPEMAAPDLRDRRSGDQREESLT